jgi:Ax21 family sulfation-dependent quorum factor
MKRALFALALAAALPISAQASELSYSFVELDYLNSNSEVLSSGTYSTEGYGIRGSFGFAENFYVSGAYSNSDFDISSGLDEDRWNVGFGYHRPLYDQTDWLVEVGYTKIDSFDPVIDDSFYDVSFGLRGSLGDKFEGIAKLSYNDGASFSGVYYPQYDSAFSATVGVQWRINDMWGIVGEIEAYEDDTDYTLGVRASF